MRLSGEGTYYKDGDYFCWKIRPAGRKAIIRKSKVQSELKKKVAEVKSELESGRVVKADKSMTVGTWLDKWFTDYVQGVRQRNTVRQYEQVIRLYLKPAVIAPGRTLGDLRLDKLDTEDCQKVIQWLMTSGRTIIDEETKKVKRGPLAKATVRTCRTILRTAIGKAVVLGAIKYNPVTDSEGPTGVRARTRVLRPDDAAIVVAELLTETMPGQFKWRYGPLILTIISTGPRITEILGALRTDVLTEADEPVALFFTHKLEWLEDGKWERSELKGEKSSRVVPLGATAKEAIKAQLRQIERDRTNAKGYRIENGLLFTTSTGEPCSPRNVQRSLDAILASVKLSHVSLHDLRRTYGTLLARKKTPDHILQALMGHSSINTTKAHYTIVLDDDALAAVSMIDEAFTKRAE